MCHQSVGLLQNAIEAAGITTVSVTVRPEITAHVGVPRAGYLRFPTGQVLGEAGATVQHEAIVRALLALAEDAVSPRTLVELPFRWRRRPREEAPPRA
jgi:D-proline reductase (dithiol) PrdB